MRIEFVRSGGFAGLARSCRLDTSTLEPRERHEVERLVAAADLADLATRAAPQPSGADRFQYDVTILDSGRRHHVRAWEGDVPARLRPLLDRLLLEARSR